MLIVLSNGALQIQGVRDSRVVAFVVLEKKANSRAH